MSRTIAITGKGGTGKTTLAGLIVGGLIRAGATPVLAVDADPNMCLDEVLGVRATQSVGRVREKLRDDAAAGISKRTLLERKIAESLVEAAGFDLIAMGRPEGPGCYCYANNILREVLALMTRQYPFTVIDNEAGLENLSRRIAPAVDLLVLVGDPSRRGIATIRRLYALAREMDVRYGKLAVVVNRVRPASAFRPDLSDLPVDALFTLPEDDDLARWGEEGRSLLEFPGDHPAARRIDAFLKEQLGVAIRGAA